MERFDKCDICQQLKDKTCPHPDGVAEMGWLIPKCYRSPVENNNLFDIKK